MTIFLLISVAACISSQGAEKEILVGRTAAGQLKIRIEFDVLGLPVSPFPGISGYATGEVGFHSTILDEPTNDFFQLSPAADFRFILQHKDPGIEVWNDHGSGYMTNGESFYVGPPVFDTHPVWNIVSGTPGNTYSITLFVRDLNGVYPDSDPFTLRFTPVAPAVLSIQNNSNNTVTVSFRGTPGLDYVVQVASALGPNTLWTNLSTNNAGDTGIWTLTEATTGHAARFYRAITP
jgi:hypothetical protein